jgi:hypothetical protein
LAWSRASFFDVEACTPDTGMQSLVDGLWVGAALRVSSKGWHRQ